MKFLKLISALLLCSVFCIGVSQAQVDSLIAQLDGDLSANERATILNQLCLSLCYSNPDTALYYGKQAVIVGKESSNDTILGKAYNRIGIVMDVTSDWDSALYYYDIAMKYAMITRDSITLSSVFNNFGLIYWNKGQHDLAVENFTQALRIADLQGIDRIQSNAYNNIGLIYWEQDRLEEALEYQMKALEIRKQSQDEYGIGASYLNIAMLYDDFEKYDSCIYFLNKSIVIKEKLNDLYGLGKACTNIGITYSNLNQLDSCFYYLKRAIAIHESTENYYNAASSMFNLGSIYYDHSMHENSLEYLNKSLALAEQYGFNKLMYKIYNNLGLNNVALRNFESSSLYFKMASNWKDSVYFADRDRAIEEVQKKYETEKQAKDIAILQKDTAEKEVKLLKRKRYIAGLLSLITLLILFSILFIQRQRSREKARRAAAVINERDKGLKAIVSATENERKRIAKDLHDGVGQQISGLKFFIQQLNLEKTENIQKASKLKFIIDELGDEVRNISHQMMPRALQELGLVAAIEDMLEKSFHGSSIEFNFEHVGLNERLVEDIEIAIYRICQELINNIIKHSKAKSVDVQLAKRKDFLFLVVEDNGVGVSGKREKNGGIGMLTIQNRLNIINGELQFDSSEGKGTIATIRVKLG